MGTRIGQGYDVHRLVSGRRLVLGGVQIPFDRGLLGHSDADVVVHAIADALLGAAALGDIGVHFPDSNQRYAGISSLLLLEEVAAMLIAAHYSIVNIDATIIAERPKVAGYIEAMRGNIARSLNADIERISLKATTTEGLGFTGRGEGIAALAVAMLERIDN